MEILCFGEILFDKIEGRLYLGGAPLNLAAHLAKLGVSAYLMSSVGDDQYGHEALKKIKELGIKTDFIKIDNAHQTGLVNVEVDSKGLPNYDFNPNTAYDYITLDSDDQQKIAQMQFDCFCFGTLAQRQATSRQTLLTILKTIKTKHIFCDLNLRANYFSPKIINDSLTRTTLLKLNETEAEYLNTTLYRDKYNFKTLAQKLIKDFSLETVVITRGDHGCLAYTADIELEVPGLKTKIINTLGAGDAFSAGFLADYLRKPDIKKACRTANDLGANVASQVGAI